MGKYNFDEHIERRGSGAIKWDGLVEHYGTADLSAFWIADMDFEVCPEIIDALKSRLEHRVLGYSVTPDSYWKSIIEWLDRRHGFKVGREELTFVPGVVKGLAYAVNYFSREGDKIVIQQPVYHPFRMVIEGNKRIVLNNPLKDCGDHYEMDIEGLRELVEREKPKMMVLCNPHNPIGIQWDEATLAAVGKIARDNGMVVVSDEIHGDLMLHGRRHLPMAGVNEDTAAVTVTLGAPSKTFNIPGMVSSWIAVKNRELREGFFQWMECNSFSEAPFTSTLAAETAYRHGEEWLDELLEYIEGNIEAVEQYCLERIPWLKIYRPEASFLVWLDCRELGLGQEELISLFVKEAHLALNDGTMFGKEGEGFMRLNVASPRAEVVKAMEEIEQAIKRNGL